MTRRTTPTACRTLTFVAVVACLAACSRAPEPYVAPSPGPASTSPSSAPSPTLPPPPPPPTDSAQPSPIPSFDQGSAANCAGHPSADQVANKVRAAGLVGRGAKLTVKAAPVCSGTWQYTVFAVSGREPLQVVTQGPASALTLVTAGTNVCSTQVIGQAPPGIIAVAQCGLGVPPAGG